MRQFPVLMRPAEWRAYPDCPKSVPWDLLVTHERQAQMNHSQTLATLASRGGLDPIEMMAVIDDAPWPWHLLGNKEVIEARRREDIDRLKALVAAVGEAGAIEATNENGTN